MRKILFLVTSILMLFTFSSNSLAKNNEKKSFADEKYSASLKNVKITPVLDTEIKTGENLIFCSTFQMAWNEMCNKYAMGTLEIENAPDYAAKLNALYKQGPLLSEDSYLAMAGSREDGILNKIKEAVMKKFGHLNKDELPLKFNFKAGPRDMVAFAYLYKNIEFEKPFDIPKPLLMLYKDKAFYVDTFGFDEFCFDKSREIDHFIKQYRLLYYKKNENNTEVIIKLLSKSNTDEIIISTLPPGKTMKESYDNIIKAIYSYSNRTSRRIETLQIPKLNFNILCEYENLSGKNIYNKFLKDYHIRKAIQRIDFNLNKNGTKVLTYEIVVYRETVFNLPIRLAIKCPFVIYLKNKNKYTPYFMAYVATPELLVPSQNIDSLFEHPKNLDSEVKLNLLLQEFCQYYEPNISELGLDLRFINVKSKDNSNTLLLALKKKDYIETKILENFKRKCINKESEFEKKAPEVKKTHYYKLIEYLIKNGANVNEPDDSGYTPLMCAVESGDHDIVKLLVESGANVKLRDKKGHDALYYAKKNKRNDVVKMLEEKLK